MNPRHLKFTVAGIILLASLSYLTYAATRGQSWVYHLSVEQFLSNPQYRTQRVRLFGKVDAANFYADSANLSAHFDLKGNSKVIPVQYHGVIPDLFKPDRDVVIEGQLDSAGKFQADVLMTKCASKYESGQKTGGAQ